MTPSQEDSRPNPQGSSTPGGGNSIADATTHGLGEELAGIGNSVLGTEAVPTTKVGPVDGSAGGSPGSDGNGQQGGRGGRDGGRSGRDGGRPGGRRGGRRGRAEELMVPEAEFTSYYGRPVVKASPWTVDIPIYLFLGGLAGSSAVLGAGGSVTGRPGLARNGRIAALGALAGSGYFLVHDLGKPSRFYNMLRIAKPTSPMSVGTWLLTAFGLPAGVAGVSELSRLLPAAVTGRLPALPQRLLHGLATPAGLASACVGPLVATYTAVLLADTATPGWFGARKELPAVFAASATAAGAGLALVTVPLDQSGPARVAGVLGAAVELGAQVPMRRSMGLAEETLHQGTAGRWHQASQVLTVAGAVLAAVSGRSRVLSAVAGVGLLGGSLATRFAVFGAGQQSAKDPKYTVVPQRERADARRTGDHVAQDSSVRAPSPAAA